MKRVRGFTLIELMIVVLIIAVLAALALSGYNKQVRKSKRAEAKQSLADLTLKQEKWRSSNASYGSCIQIVDPVNQAAGACTSYNSSLKHYTVAVTANSTTGYTMTATPKTTDQAKDSCGTMTIRSTAGVVDKLPTTEGCW